MYVNAPALVGGIQLRQQTGQAPKTFGLFGVLEGLVLGQNVNEPLTDIIAMLEKQLPAPVAEPVQDLADLALGRENRRFRHSAPPRGSGRSPDAHASVLGRRPGDPRRR